MTVFYLMRHGQPDWPLAEARKLIGHSADLVPLTPTGISEVQARIPEIAGFGIEQIISSPMTRALQTGQLIASTLQLPLNVEFDLHEWIPDLACTWSSGAEVHTLYEDYDNCNGEPPVGEKKPWEPKSRLRTRASEVLTRYTNLEKVLVTCHCLVIESLTGEILEHAGIVPFLYPEF